MNFQCVWIIEIVDGEKRVPVRGDSNGKVIGFYSKKKAEEYAEKHIRFPHTVRFV